MQQYSNKQFRNDHLQAAILLVVFLLVTLITSAILYFKVQALFRWSLDERLIAITTSSALHFNPADLDRIGGHESIGSPEHTRAVLTLRKIKETVHNVKWVYIFRRTDDSLVLEFVAEAESLDPNIVADDFNGDGLLDETDLTFPGDAYDITDTPDYGQIPFNEPYVESELDSDEWGTILAGAAPILDHEGRPTNYILGIDVDVSDYHRLVNSALLPFALFVAFLVFVLTALTVILRRMWLAQVKLLEELDRQKDELISIVSHQLNTPVTSVKWNIEMMLDGDMGEVTGEQKKQLQTMQSVTTDLADLVAMMLDVSRIQLGRMKVDRAEVDLSAFFKEILLVIDPKVEMKKQKIVKNIPANLPVAMLDKRLLRMTLENLLTNAVKYTPEGGTVTLHVEAKDGKLRYEVRDTGYGIPKAEQGKIFGKLFRASNAQQQEGNGLGLFAAKGAVEAQGGSIRFESEEGKGAVFFVELPLEVPEQGKAKA